MSSLAIRLISIFGVLSILICAACGIENKEEPAEITLAQTMTMNVYLDHESEAVRTWKNEGKGAPNEIRLEFARDGSISFWWDSAEPMPLTDAETETLFWAIANVDEPQVTTHMFIGELPGPQLSFLLAQASKAAIGNERSLIINNYFVSCAPSDL